MIHRPDAELRSWLDRPDPADRDRIVGHLAGCDACSSRVAEMVRTAPLAQTDSRFDAASFRSAGYNVLRSRTGWRLRSPLRTLAPLGAAAAVIMIVGGTYFVSRREPARVTRGAETGVELIAPAGGAGAREALRFEWRAPENTKPHALRVYDLASPVEPVISEDGVNSGYVPTAEERQRLKPGVTYRWFIEYRSAGETAVSPAGTFSIR